MPEFASTATDTIQTLITQIGQGQISLRDAERLRQKTSTLGGVVENIERIAKHGENIARSSARLVRDIEQLATEIDDFRTKRAENDARRCEADARRAHVAEAVRAEQRVRALTAQNLGDELQEQIDARRAAREREKQRVEQERATAEQRVDRRRASRDARVDAARRKNEGEAARIVRDVQIGAVPADPAHPYHAYAASIYLAARLEDDLSSEEAAARTRDAVLGLMLGPTARAMGGGLCRVEIPSLQKAGSHSSASSRTGTRPNRRRRFSALRPSASSPRRKEPWRTPDGFRWSGFQIPPADQLEPSTFRRHASHDAAYLDWW